MDSQFIGSLIDDIIDGNASAAKEKFDGAISVKVSDSLEKRKVELANSLYNSENQSEEEVSSEEQKEEEQVQ